ncbi:DUF5685 family protein [Marinitoga sp. 38H-ov]|uniref:DUF5685 family protein n=1 Tax=Marinitoga sp. 38H-ov TaxID=1755814 RepID=UPI0013EBE2E2|nr:DUF5685 family protein [Marinitoga sp. 38H-ov]KAF2956388.1 hypothetical protein AS160_06695 [Marinitoga sp. 38H-ov]
MYGYISLYFKPNKYEQINYISHYCSMCHSLKKEFGNMYRMFIIREVSFFSLIKIEFNNKKIRKINCPWVGFKERYVYNDLEVFKEFSYLNNLIIYGKLYDKLYDSNMSKYKILITGLRKKLMNYYGLDFIIKYESILDKQFEIEKNYLPLEEYFKPSINIIKLILEKHDLNVPEEFSFYVGTLLYLLDAIYDFNKDIKKKNFNPIFTVYNINDLHKLHKEDKEFLDFIIDFSIKKIISILEKSDIKNKHFAKKLFSFSAIYHKSKIDKLFLENECKKKDIKSNNLYLNIRNKKAPL